MTEEEEVLYGLLRYDRGERYDQRHRAPSDTGASSTKRQRLNRVGRPRIWRDSVGNTWIRHVSAQPGTGVDVERLTNHLDAALVRHSAKPHGVCPIRESLYLEAFNEIIRQITVQCEEQGDLLLRVRDHFLENRQTLKSLYESSVAFGFRKALHSEEEKKELLHLLEWHEEKNTRLTGNRDELERKIETLTRVSAEERERLREEYAEELERLKRRNRQLKFKLYQHMKV